MVANQPLMNTSQSLPSVGQPPGYQQTSALKRTALLVGLPHRLTMRSITSTAVTELRALVGDETFRVTFRETPRGTPTLPNLRMNQVMDTDVRALGHQWTTTPPVAKRTLWAPRLHHSLRVRHPARSRFARSCCRIAILAHVQNKRFHPQASCEPRRLGLLYTPTAHESLC
jgi:hypothetical protein